MIWCFMSLSILFNSYWHNGRMIMKGSVQWSNTVMSWIPLPMGNRAWHLVILSRECYPLGHLDASIEEISTKFQALFLYKKKKIIKIKKTDRVICWFRFSGLNMIFNHSSYAGWSCFSSRSEILSLFCDTQSVGYIAPDNTFLQYKKMLIFFLFVHKIICSGYSLEAPHWGTSNEYPHLIVLGFNDTSTLEGHFVSSPREREKRDRRESRGDEREGQGRKRNRKESEETEEIKTFPLYPYPLQG